MSRRQIASIALVVVAGVTLVASCADKASAPTQLPPSGLAGAPSAPIPVDPNATMPAGHPPIDGAHGMAGSAPSPHGDDGAPIPAKSAQGGLALPNLPGMNTGGNTAGAAPMGEAIGGGVVFSGKVMEKLDVPSYTYMRVQTAGGVEEWVAVSTMTVNVGDTVTINQQIVMNNFPSKTLGRTFEKLVMGTAVVGG